MKLFLASSLYQMGRLTTTYVGSLENKTIAYITNPADQDIQKHGTNLWWIKNDKDLLESLGAKLYGIDLKKMKEKELQKEIQKCSLIYVSWGNTYYFNELAIESWFNRVIPKAVKEWWIKYLSTSAWSCMVGSTIQHIEKWRNRYIHFEWFNLINAMIVPHRWSDDFQEEYEHLIPLRYKNKRNVITLTDTQAIVADDDHRKIVEKY